MQGLCGESEKSMKLWFDLFKLLIPNLPASYGKAKSRICSELERIAMYDVCPNACIVYYNCRNIPDYQYAQHRQCPVCGESRDNRKVFRMFKYEQVFHYIPLIPQLRNMYAQPELVQHLKLRSRLSPTGWFLLLKILTDRSNEGRD